MNSLVRNWILVQPSLLAPLVSFSADRFLGSPEMKKLGVSHTSF